MAAVVRDLHFPKFRNPATTFHSLAPFTHPSFAALTALPIDANRRQHILSVRVGDGRRRSPSGSSGSHSGYRWGSFGLRRTTCCKCGFWHN